MTPAKQAAARLLLANQETVLLCDLCRAYVNQSHVAVSWHHWAVCQLCGDDGVCTALHRAPSSERWVCTECLPGQDGVPRLCDLCGRHNPCRAVSAEAL